MAGKLVIIKFCKLLNQERKIQNIVLTFLFSRIRSNTLCMMVKKMNKDLLGKPLSLLLPNSAKQPEAPAEAELQLYFQLSPTTHPTGL